MDPKDVVRRGYDRVSWAYRADDAEALPGYARWIAELRTLLAPGDRVLDLGCGSGVPVARELAASDMRVTGVDLSEVQIERARTLVPRAEFVCADITEVDFPEASFDAVVSFYAIIHVPVEEHRSLLGRISSWLVAGGLFMATLGHEAWTGTEDHWLGVEGATMYWSHTDAGTYRTWLAEAGFDTVRDEFVPEGDSGHQLFVARKPSEGSMSIRDQGGPP